jgi:hypothetical protein
MSIENNEKCTYISTQLIFSASNVKSSESVKEGQSYCRIPMNNIQGLLLPPGLSTFLDNNILYFSNDTESIKTLRLGFNIVNSTKAVGRSQFLVCGSCFKLSGVMRLLTIYADASSWQEFINSDTDAYECNNGQCDDVLSASTCTDINTSKITNGKLKPIVLQPNTVYPYAVGFGVDFYCQSLSNFGCHLCCVGGIDFTNNFDNRSKFTVIFLTFE